MKSFYFSFCALVTACTTQATSPTLSTSLIPPSTLQFSWPSNFAGWQLTSTTNLPSTNWQPLGLTPVISSNKLTVLSSFTNSRSFFRLEQPVGGCVFQATPSVINSGSSSSLTWCPVAGFTYRLSPGPGVVAGSSLLVSPTVTTAYTLTASNASGIVTNFTPVIVNPCGFSNVTNWLATVTFSYNKNASASGFNFTIRRFASATLHLTRSTSSGGNTIYFFDGPTGQNVSINDEEVDTSGGDPVISTTVGDGIPSPIISTFTLDIDCNSGTYNFAAIVAVDSIDTSTSDGISSSSPRTAIAGQFVVFPRPLPTSVGTLSGFIGAMPVAGPFSAPTSNYFTPNDSIPNDMWINGVVTDATAGTAIVDWSITPVP